MFSYSFINVVVHSFDTNLKTKVTLHYKVKMGKMIGITILSIGKDKESWLIEGIKEYLKRLKSHFSINFKIYKNNSALIKGIEEHSSVIALDPQGKTFSSESFSRYFYSKIEQGGSRLSFIIGGPEGLPKEIRAKYPLISLSSLTFTHQMTRLILVEQLYRAWSLHENHPYHKG